MNFWQNEKLSREVDLLDERFDEFPLLVEGESKIIRDVGDERVLIRLKPTLFSYSTNRCDVVEETDRLRLAISKRLWRCLAEAGVEVSILGVGQRSYLARKVKSPPIEVIVKACQIGTPKHIYEDMETFQTRFGDYVRPGDRHEPYVRFDWRNPIPGRDECMPIWLADRFIDTRVGERTALKAFAALSDFLMTRQIELLDICFFITEDGREIYGEVSPDCMRAKYSGDDLDKDLWRKGKTHQKILDNWTRFLDLVEAPRVA